MTYPNRLIQCACGCGEIGLKVRVDRRINRFVYGHHRRGQSNYWRISDNPTERTVRTHSVKILKACGVTDCQAKSTLCRGALQAHHLDKNPFNNDISNLLLLCRSHHKTADLRNLNLKSLIADDANFFRDTKGYKRRIKKCRYINNA